MPYLCTQPLALFLSWPIGGLRRFAPSNRLRVCHAASLSCSYPLDWDISTRERASAFGPASETMSIRRHSCHKSRFHRHTCRLSPCSCRSAHSKPRIYVSLARLAISNCFLNYWMLENFLNSDFHFFCLFWAHSLFVSSARRNLDHSFWCFFSILNLKSITKN